MAKIYDIVEISKLVKEKLKKEFPNLTFSIRTKRFAGGQSIDVDLLKGDILFFNGEQKSNYDIGYLRDNYDGIFTDEGFKVAKRIKEIVNEFNWDNSDPMTDYFDVNYYTHISIGSWNKPYEYVQPKGGAKPTPQKSYPKRTTPAPSKNADKENIGYYHNWVLTKSVLKDYDNAIVYSLEKGDGLKNIPYDKFLEFKGEMYTELGMKWNKQFQKFDKWKVEPDVNKLSDIVRKYYVFDGVEQQEPKKEEEFKVGDVYLDKLSMGKLEITHVGLNELLVHIQIGNYLETYNKVYARLMIERGDWIKVIDEEKEEPKPKVQSVKLGDLYQDTQVNESFVIEDLYRDMVKIRYVESKLDVKFTMTNFFERVNRGIFVLINELPKQEEAQFKVGDIYRDAYSKKDLQIIKIDGDTIFFTLNGTQYNVGRIIAESYLTNKIWTKQAPTQASQEEIRNAIEALQILADDGDEEAQKAIIALEILLN